MGKINKVKHEIALREWKEIVKAQQESSLNVLAFCRQNNLSKDAFYYWNKLIKEEAIDNLPQEVKSELNISNTTEEVKFKKLEVESGSVYGPAIVIHTNGSTIEVNNGTSIKTLEAVLVALRSVC